MTPGFYCPMCNEEWDREYSFSNSICESCKTRIHNAYSEDKR